MDDPVTTVLLDVLAASGVTITHEQTPAARHGVTAIDPGGIRRQTTFTHFRASCPAALCG